MLEDNPSLRALRATLADRIWPRAARLFAGELAIHGFDAQAALAWLSNPPERCFDLDREELAEGW